MIFDIYFQCGEIIQERNQVEANICSFKFVTLWGSLRPSHTQLLGRSLAYLDCTWHQSKH